MRSRALITRQSNGAAKRWTDEKTQCKNANAHTHRKVGNMRASASLAAPVSASAQVRNIEEEMFAEVKLFSSGVKQVVVAETVGFNLQILSFF